MKQAVFLDRDGIINEVLLREEKPFSPTKFEEFKVRSGVDETLRRFKEKGFLNIIVTNQPEVARGLLKEKELKRMHDFIREKLLIDDIMVCFHDDKDNCLCRKPKSGMLLDAANKWDIDLDKSFLIGDQWKDMHAGKSVGCTTIIINYPYNQEAGADFRVKDLQSCVEIILNNRGGEQK